MPRTHHAQLSVRSAFARAKAQDLAKLTGMTMTQVVEDALRVYVPSGGQTVTGRLVRRGPILVWVGEGRKISFAEAEAALNASRERDDG